MMEWLFIICILILFIMNITTFKLLNNQGEALYLLQDEVNVLSGIFNRENSQSFSTYLTEEQAKELMKALGVEDD